MIIKANEQIGRDHFEGGANMDNNNELRDVLNRMKTALARAGAPIITATQMIAIGPNDRWHGMTVNINGNIWYWHNTTAVAADALMVIDATDEPTLGAWLLAPGQDAQISLTVAFGLADAAVLLTVPTGAVIMPRHFWWTISTDWTGGTSSAIGVSTDAAAHTTKGDLLGGASGDIAANLEAADSPTFGTVGAVWTTPAERELMIVATEIIRYDEITSAFTAGAGTVEMIARILANPGA